MLYYHGNGIYKTWVSANYPLSEINEHDYIEYPKKRKLAIQKLLLGETLTDKCEQTPPKYDEDFPLYRLASSGDTLYPTIWDSRLDQLRLGLNNNVLEFKKESHTGHLISPD